MVDPSMLEGVGITHHRSMHDPKTSHCHGTVGMDRNQCTCRQYIGPEPFTDFYTPSLVQDQG